MSAKLAGAEVAQTLRSLEAQIEDFIRRSKPRFDRQFRHQDGNAYVLKYIPPTRLASFMKNKRLYASDVAGYTWGDAVYVAPVESRNSSAFSRMC